MRDKKKQLNFENEISRILDEYKYDKNYLLLAFKNIKSGEGKQMYIVSAPTYQSGNFDGEVTITVSGTEEDVKKFLPIFKNKIKTSVCDEPGLTVKDPYYNQVGLPLPLPYAEDNK